MPKNQSTHISKLREIDPRPMGSVSAIRLYFDAFADAEGAAKYLWKERRLTVGLSEADAGKPEGYKAYVKSDETRALDRAKFYVDVTGTLRVQAVLNLLRRDHHELLEHREELFSDFSPHFTWDERKFFQVSDKHEFPGGRRGR